MVYVVPCYWFFMSHVVFYFPSEYFQVSIFSGQAYYLVMRISVAI
jgi:hypothetical protein